MDQLPDRILVNFHSSSTDKALATALITGASSGIGLEISTLFAKGGDNVVLVARSEEKLNQLADKLRSTYGIIATVIPCDLSKGNAVDELCEQLASREIEVSTLVNNAGFGALGKFSQLSADRQTEMLMVNVVALTRLTRRLLPSMIERGQGGILNVGSIAAYQAGPNMSVYYASKAYVMSFTEGLREELKGSGLKVTCLEPGPTSTGFGDDSGMGKLSMFSSQAMTAQAVARAGYEGYKQDQGVVIPGWKNRLMVTSSGFVPRFLSRKIIGRMQEADS